MSPSGEISDRELGKKRMVRDSGLAASLNQISESGVGRYKVVSIMQCAVLLEHIVGSGKMQPRVAEACLQRLAVLRGCYPWWGGPELSPYLKKRVSVWRFAWVIMQFLSDCSVKPNGVQLGRSR